jgi:hypothetical protein
MHYNQDRPIGLLTQNFMWVGYHAWQGYLTSDRGVIVISHDPSRSASFDQQWGDSSQHCLNFRYIPQLQLPLYLQEWLVPAIAIESILPAVASYQPDTELIFALESGVNVDIGWCQRLKISPPECYGQISRRWSEFQLGSRG